MARDRFFLSVVSLLIALLSLSSDSRGGWPTQALECPIQSRSVRLSWKMNMSCASVGIDKNASRYLE
jgi:hypothetical protein